MRERTKQEVLDYLASIGCRKETDDEGKETGKFTVPRNSRVGLRWLGAVKHFGIELAKSAEQ